MPRPTTNDAASAVSAPIRIDQACRIDSPYVGFQNVGPCGNDARSAALAGTFEKIRCVFENGLRGPTAGTADRPYVSEGSSDARRVEQIQGVAADGREVLRNESILGGRHDIQRQRSVGQERKPVLVRAVVRTSAVLVMAAVLVVEGGAFLVPVIACGLPGVDRCRGRRLVMHGTVAQYAQGRFSD